MGDVPRRTLSELNFIYSANPGRRDVYVEGPFDEAVLRWFCHECNLDGIAVYPIAAIEIPERDLIKAGQGINNRERVVFLSNFLFSISAKYAVCVVDADFSYIRGIDSAEPPLYETDYACMEMYFFCLSNFKRFFMLCCRRYDWPIETIMNSLASILQELFLYRCANDELGWGMDWLDRIACMNVDEWMISLDTEEYIKRFLNKNGRGSEKDTFINKVEDIRPKLKTEPRFQMNGHDLTKLLVWLIRKKGISGVHTRPESVQMFMTLTLNHQEIIQECMFQRIAKHLA